MKIRIASSVALAAGIALGATGCGLIAPQGTTDPYSPSDGVDVNIEVNVPADVLTSNGEFVRGDDTESEERSIDLRNLLLVPDETGDNLNVVFTAVNNTTVDQQLAMTFSYDGDTSSVLFDVPTGTTRYGDPEGEDGTVQLLQLPSAIAGSAVSASYEVADQFGLGFEVFCNVTHPEASTADSEDEDVPEGCFATVHDPAQDGEQGGTGLQEYSKYVLPEGFLARDGEAKPADVTLDDQKAEQGDEDVQAQVEEPQEDAAE